MAEHKDKNVVREAVRDRYAEVAKAGSSCCGAGASCCGTTSMAVPGA
jgi:hypothetical protein